MPRPTHSNKTWANLPEQSVRSRMNATTMNDKEARDSADVEALADYIEAHADDIAIQALATLTSASNSLPYFTGVGTAAVTTLSPYARTLLASAGASAARGLIGGAQILDVKVDFSAVGDNVADDRTAINNAIAAYNATVGPAVLFLPRPSTSYLISGGLNAITKSNGAVIAQHGTIVNLTDNVGTFFTLGAIGTPVTKFRMEGLTLKCSGVPTAHAIVAPDLDDSYLDVRMENVAGLLMLGDPTAANNATVSRLKGRITGTVRNSSTLSWIHSQSSAGSGLFVHVTSGPQTPNGQAYLRFGGGDALNDTFDLLPGSVMFANPGGGGTVGIPYSVRVDATLGAVNNLTIHGTLDGSDTAAIFYRGDSSVVTSRGYQFRCRMETAAGAIVDFLHQNNGSFPFQDFDLSHCRLFYGNASDNVTPFTFIGDQVSGVAVDDNRIFEMGSGTVPRMFLWRITDWSARGNKIRKTSNTNFINANYIHETGTLPTSGDSDRFVTEGNVYPPPTGGYLTGTRGYFKHAAYAANSKNRRVRDFFNGSQVRYGDQIGGVITATAITQFKHYYNLIRIEEVARLTGIVSRTGAVQNGNLKVALWDIGTSGNFVAIASSGSTAAAAANAINEVAFTTATVVNPGDYLISIMSDSATQELLMSRRQWPYGSTTELAFALPASVTPPTTEPGALTPLLTVF